MTNGASMETAPPRARGRDALGRNARIRLAGRRLRRIRRTWYAPPPTMEEVEERIRGYRGFFASLTPEQLAFVKAWDGPDIHGDPNGPKRQF